MGTNAAELRAEIEETRADLSRDLDAIGDRVSPRRMVERRTGRMRQWGTNAREAMFGTAYEARDRMGSSMHHMGDSAHHVAESVGGTVHDAPAVARERTAGNPMLTGAIAFGMGFLVSMAFAPSETEEEAVQRLEQRTGPLTEPVKEMAKEVAGSIQPAAREAGEQLKQEAAEVAGSVKGAARDEAAAVKDTAKEQAQQARTSTRRT